MSFFSKFENRPLFLACVFFKIPDWLTQEVWRREEMCRQITKSERRQAALDNLKLDKVKDVKLLWLEEENRRFRYYKEFDGATMRGYFTVTEVNQNDLTFVGLWEKATAPGIKNKQVYEAFKQALPGDDGSGPCPCVYRPCDNFG